MWKELQQNPLYLINFPLKERYEILVTNYTNLWFVFLSKEHFLSSLKESNFGLELCNDEEWLQKGSELLKNPMNLKKLQISQGECGKLLNVFMTVSYGYPFKVRLILKEASKEFFFQAITQQFIQIIVDLRESEEVLRKLLMKKDSEIEEYKCQGGQIPLRHLKTPPFDNTSHMLKHNAFEGYFGSSNLLSTLLKQAVEVPEKIVKKETNEISNEIKRELSCIKMETETPTEGNGQPPMIIHNTTASENVKQEKVKSEATTLSDSRKKKRKGLNY